MNPGMVIYFKDLSSLRSALQKTDKNGNPVVTKEEVADLIFGLMDYAQKGEEPGMLSPACQMAFDFMVQKLDRDIAKYESCVTNGRKGGRPKNPTKPNKTQRNPSKPSKTQANPENQNENVNVNENENVNENVCVNEADENTHKPTLDEVKAFIKAEGLEAIPEDFYNYYQASNWMRGHNPIDWKAACRFWKNRGIVPISAGKKKIIPAQDFQQRDYTEEQMKRTTDEEIMKYLNNRKETAN